MGLLITPLEIYWETSLRLTVNKLRRSEPSLRKASLHPVQCWSKSSRKRSFKMVQMEEPICWTDSLAVSKTTTPGKRSWRTMSKLRLCWTSIVNYKPLRPDFWNVEKQAEEMMTTDKLFWKDSKLSKNRPNHSSNTTKKTLDTSTHSTEYSL